MLCSEAETCKCRRPIKCTSARCTNCERSPCQSGKASACASPSFDVAPTHDVIAAADACHDESGITHEASNSFWAAPCDGPVNRVWGQLAGSDIWCFARWGAASLLSNHA